MIYRSFFPALILLFCLLSPVHSQQQIQNQSPPREQWSQKAETNKQKTEEPKRTSATQIECDPNCTRKDGEEKGHQSYFARAFEKGLDDPIILLTLIIAIANILLVGTVVCQVRDARKSSERQLRAYVVVLPNVLINQDPHNNITYEFQPTIKNTGETPAYDLHYLAKCDVLPTPLPAGYDLTLRQNPNNTILPSIGMLGRDETSFMIVPLNRILTTSQEQEIHAPTAPQNLRLHVWGTVYYTDAFHKEQWANFCFYILWGSAGIPAWISTHQHNNGSRQ